MTGPLVYLIVTTFRNRLVVMARRVKQPRYAIGLILGVAYMWFSLWGQSMGAGNMRGGLLQNDAVRTLAPVVLVLLLATTWFGGATLNALAFTQAEASLLFPAPVSRRALVLYKIGTAQVPILINALILAFILGRGPAAIPRWLAVISLWATFSTLHLHRLGAALTFASTAEHGKSGFKRNWFAHVVSVLIFAVIFATIFGSVTAGAFEARPVAASPLSTIRQITESLSHPVAQVALYPFAVIAAPAFARSVGEWAAAMGPALLVMILHLFWVLRSQTAFEEAAAEASVRRHQMVETWRKRGVGGGVARGREGRTIAIGATGHPAIAIIWKNMLAFLRTVRPTQFLATMGVPIGVIGYFAHQSGKGALAIAAMCGSFALMLLLTGGSTVRNDLRADMLNLDQLKTLPLHGREIVVAEVVSSALPLALIQLVLLLIALVSLQLSTRALPAGVTISILLSLPIGVAALNFALSTIRNGAVVLFPAWSKLGIERTGPGGFEVVGQAMLSMLAMLMTFLALMVVPALVTLFVALYVRPPAAAAVIFSVVVSAAALAAECYGLIIWLGRAFERTEPSASISAS